MITTRVKWDGKPCILYRESISKYIEETLKMEIQLPVFPGHKYEIKKEEVIDFFFENNIMPKYWGNWRYHCLNRAIYIDGLITSRVRAWISKRVPDVPTEEISKLDKPFLITFDGSKIFRIIKKRPIELIEEVYKAVIKKSPIYFLRGKGENNVIIRPISNDVKRVDLIGFTYYKGVKWSELRDGIKFLGVHVGHIKLVNPIILVPNKYFPNWESQHTLFIESQYQEYIDTLMNNEIDKKLVNKLFYIINTRAVITG